MKISSLFWKKGDTKITWQSSQGTHEIKLSAPLGHLIILSDKSGFLAIEDTGKSDPNKAPSHFELPFVIYEYKSGKFVKPFVW